MRVGFDAHMVGQRETGNETYARGLLTGLERIGFPVDVYSLEPLHSTIHRDHRLWPHQPGIRIPLSIPGVAMRDRLDLFHATYVLPPFLPCRSVVSIHDVTYLLHPEWFAPKVRHMLAALVPLSIRKASRVITLSENSKRDIVERYRVRPEDVAVTYLAPRPEFAEPLAERSEEAPYLLYVGNIEPRKDIATVVRAVAVLRDRGVEVPLVVAGKPGLRAREAEKLVCDLRLEGQIEFRGYVPDDELRRLYASCTALVHPALYEGFGLTLLEAMVQGAPVLVADTSSVREVVNEAAVLLPPGRPEVWAEAIERILNDPAARSQLALKGRNRAFMFSWEECARRTVDVYSSVVL